MSATPNAARAEIVHPPKRATGTYILFTLTAALTAASAAFATASLGWAPWIMFMGWVAYFTRPNLADGLQSFACAVIGLTLGALATVAIGELSPILGPAALPAVVFTVACLVIAMRGLPALSNLLGYFIGLITFFAAHREPTAGTVATLAAAIAIGFTAGFVAQQIEAAIRKRFG